MMHRHVTDAGQDGQEQFKLGWVWSFSTAAAEGASET